MRKENKTSDDRYVSLNPPYSLFEQVQSKLLKRYYPARKTLADFRKEFETEVSSKKLQGKDFLQWKEEFTKKVKSYLSDDDYVDGLKLKKEFIKRNEEFQKIKSELLNLMEEFCKEDEDDKRIPINKNLTRVELGDKKQRIVKRMFEIGQEIVPNVEKAEVYAFISRSLIKKWDIKAGFPDIHELPPFEFEDLLISSTFSPIDLVYSEEDKIRGYRNVKPQEISIFEESRKHFSKTLGEWKREREEDGPPSPDSSDALALDAINLEEKTITIKINLNRQKEDIRNHLDFLLDLLEFEANLLGYKLGSPKKPQWDVYDKYLQVYDLRKTNPPMIWPEIAKRVFPQEVEKHKAPHRKTRKTELASRTSIKKVKYYYEEAVKMINGGWRNI